MLKKLIDRENFSSYEDFIENFSIHIPNNFNFAYDVVDAIAMESPDRVAMVWCDDKGNEATFTFADMKYYSDKTANFFHSKGICKGDKVMLILKRRYEFWFSILALHKIGAVGIPATHLLTTKDIVYRINAADIKMIVSVDEDEVVRRVDEAQQKAQALTLKAVVGGQCEGWYDYTAEVKQASDNFRRPTGDKAPINENIMLLYFTSGTTGMPKMVQHNFTYPLGHVTTGLSAGQMT